MRKTKIIATIGPKTDSSEMLSKLADEGMDIARINMSHATQEYASKIISKIKEMGRNISILLDTQGPEIRTSVLDKDMHLKEGSLLRITVDSACDTNEAGVPQTSVDYAELIHDVKKGNNILIDDGKVELEVVEVKDHYITCKVLNTGVLGSRKAVNLPGIKVNTPTMTKKDISDIEFAIEQEVDFIAMSFVRQRENVQKLRNMLKEKNSSIQIISKIEDLEGLSNIAQIVQASDGVMIARGDMGVEIPIEEVPIMQKRIVDICLHEGRPVIVATHLLDSMVEYPRPTRAEVTDVANAVFQTADCVMLSAETTKGKYPVESVKTIAKICERAEQEVKPIYHEFKHKNVKEEIARLVCSSAENLGAKAILVFTRSGRLASLVARNRPTPPIYVFTPSDGACRRTNILWGTKSFVVELEKQIEKSIEKAEDMLKEKGLLERDDLFTVVSVISPVHHDVEVLEVRRVR